MQRPVQPISSWFLSAVIHVSVLLALLLGAAVLGPPTLLPPHPDLTIVLREPLRAPRIRQPQERNSGGGQNSPLPAQKGALPQKPRSRMFIPPMVAVNDSPKLTLAVALQDSPVSDAQGMIGDPLGIGVPGGGGRGVLGGFGDGNGGGVGDQSGGGVSSIAVSQQKLTRRPELIYKEEPVYSEPARRARVQGYVRLRIDVGVDGRPTNIQVISGMGMGLDESAIDAVKRWRFRPALIGDRPVAAPATVEVGFHLL